jgi:hypothetical protein
MLLSVPLLLEYEDDLKRPQHLLATGFRAKWIDELLDELVGLAEPVSVTYLWRPQLSDPADEMVLEAAVNGGTSEREGVSANQFINIAIAEKLAV